MFTGQPEVPCSLLQEVGYNGQIPLDICPSLRFSPEIGVCECRAFGPIASIAPIAPVAPIAPSAPGAPIDPMVPTFAPSSPTPVPKTIAPSGAGKTPVPAPALPTSDTKSKKDSKKKMSKIHKP